MKSKLSEILQALKDDTFWTWKKDQQLQSLKIQGGLLLNTPLHWAFQQKTVKPHQKTLLKKFLENDLLTEENLHQVNSNGKTPLQILAKQNLLPHLSHPKLSLKTLKNLKKTPNLPQTSHDWIQKEISKIQIQTIKSLQTKTLPYQNLPH